MSDEFEELHMPLKILHRNDAPFSTGSAEDDFRQALDSRPNYPSNENAFLPDMEAIATSNSNLLVVNRPEVVTDLKAYRVLVPGFVYVQHWAGNWNPSGWLQILVSNTETFDQAYELMNTDGNGADHVNNMFPIRPGSNTCILLRGIIDKIDENTQCRKSVYFVPAWGWSRSSGRVETNRSVRMIEGISNVNVLSGRGDNLAGFKNCFRQIIQGGFYGL